jgi:hypothetical protein
MSEIWTVDGREIRIDREWDEDSGLWSVTSPDVPGLVLQVWPGDDLQAKLDMVVPALEAPIERTI